MATHQDVRLDTINHDREDSVSRTDESTRPLRKQEPVKSSSACSVYLVGILVLVTICQFVVVIGVTSSIRHDLEQAASGPLEAVTVMHEPAGLPGWENWSWKEVMQYSVGQTVTIGMQKGYKASRWIREVLAPMVLAEANIKINLQDIYNSTSDILDKVEQDYAQNKKSSIDMIWMNGANYYRARTGAGAAVPRSSDILYGPWANRVPAMANFDWTSPVIGTDFGHPNQGFEMPYFRANFVLIYRTDLVPSPPQSWAALVAMLQPGGLLHQKFTYPAPYRGGSANSGTVEGGAFVKNFLYEFGGGPDAYAGDFEPTKQYNANARKAFAKLRELEGGPSRANLYNNPGAASPYCDTLAECYALFRSGSILMTMSYTATTAGSNCIAGGTLPTQWKDAQVTTLDGVTMVSLCSNIMSYVPVTGAVSNMNFFQIFAHSPNIVPSVVVGNYIGAIESQFSRRSHSTNATRNWGWIQGYSATAPAIVSGGWKVAFDYLSLESNYPQTPPTAQLRVPFSLAECHGQYETLLREDWKTCVGTVPYGSQTAAGVPCV